MTSRPCAPDSRPLAGPRRPRACALPAPTSRNRILMVRSLCRLAFLFLIGASLCAPSVRAEDAQAHARELFQRGVKAVAAGDLTGALAHFQEAYDKSPNQTVL